MKVLTLHLAGQIRGGKNNMIVLRNGMHIPKKTWAEWRDIAVSQLRAQRCGFFFEKPCKIEVLYWCADLRRRDVPGLADSLCHCLEHAGIVKDDSLLTDWTWSFRGLDRDKPRAAITITEDKP